MEEKENYLNVVSCTGCRACEQACPVNAIEMRENYMGFLVPYIEDSKCIHCGKCRNVCHALDKKGKHLKQDNIVTYACKNTNEEIRMKSSSGGLFYLFASEIINAGGVVYGAGYNEEFEVQHLRIQKSDEIIQLMGSKYVQSNLNNTYVSIQNDLATKRQVLFVGTPCQVAGLLTFLTKSGCDSTNLLTMDLVCHGVPSPLIWREYLKYVKEKYAIKKIYSVYFRHKKDGWHKRIKMRFLCDFQDGEQVKPSQTLIEDNVFTELFLSDLVLRESCHQCQYASKERVADITVCDFWGIEETELCEMDDDKGVSAVMIHTVKGENIWDKIKENCEYRKIGQEIVQNFQKTMKQSYPRPENKDMMWNDYYKDTFDKLIDKYLDVNNERKYKYVVIAPDGSGGKGDEAMLRGVLQLLNYDDVLLVTPNTRFPCADALLDIKDKIEEAYVREDEIEKVVSMAINLIVVGADVIDGTCGVEYSLSRLKAMQKMIDVGGRAYCFCSFRSNVDKEIVQLIKELDSNNAIKFYLRDKKSIENFAEQINRKTSFFPDFAFYCNKKLSQQVLEYKSVIEEKKARGFEIVGVNFSEQSFNSFYEEKNLENRLAYIYDTISTVTRVNPNSFLIFISHDIREWDNHLSDASYQKMAYKCIENMEIRDKAMIVRPEISYPELMELLADFDYLISARMHLAIATIRSGTIPIVYTGNGSKGTFSMNEKIEGMLQERIGRTDLLATNQEQLKEAITVIHREKELIENMINTENERNLCIENKYKLKFQEELKVNQKSVVKDEDELFNAKKLVRELREVIMQNENNFEISLKNISDMQHNMQNSIEQQQQEIDFLKSEVRKNPFNALLRLTRKIRKI